MYVKLILCDKTTLSCAPAEGSVHGRAVREAAAKIAVEYMAELSVEQKALKMNLTDRFDELLQSQHYFESEVKSRGAKLVRAQHQQSTEIEELKARMDGYEGGQRELPGGSVVQRRVLERRELALSEQPQAMPFVNCDSRKP